MAKTSAERSRDYRAKDVEAYRERKRELAKTENHKETRAAYMRLWRSNPENRLRHNELSRISHAKNKYKHNKRDRNYHLLNEYGITIEQKEEMILNQANTCLICKGKFKEGRSPPVDHCHETGKIRGILCMSCNTRLGWYEKNQNNIEEYLNGSKESDSNKD